MIDLSRIHEVNLVQVLANACQKWDYAYFTENDYNLNIIGIRNKERECNKFNDFITLTFKVNGKWVAKIYPATTDPGKTYLNTPMSGNEKKGTAIIVPYQYRGIYQLGLHKNQYEALVQKKGPIAVYRDNNRDNRLDYDPRTIESGYFGTNIHRASTTGTSVEVNNWSAGCQVIANINNYNEFISICKKSAAIYGNSFTYTLFDQRQID